MEKKIHLLTGYSDCIFAIKNFVTTVAYLCGLYFTLAYLGGFIL